MVILKKKITNYETISHSFNGSRNATTLKFQHKLEFKNLASVFFVYFSWPHKNPTKIRLCQYPMKTRAKSYIFVF
ncbi:hypothetical protein HMPREF1397_00050 [Helicobacter pylori GAM115Ai]|nr:hypothetical protein HMPREF1397_00050 [Helicobacter pylori GAM115Ai]